MRKLLATVLLLLSVNLIAQTGEIIYKEWAFLGESSTQIDVSYRVIRCSTENEIHLQIFNENPNDQVAHFDVAITNNSDGAKFTKEITFSLDKAKIYRAECGSDTSLSALKIALPSGYDPANLTVKLTFKP
jgi:hypothetical protein